LGTANPVTMLDQVPAQADHAKVQSGLALTSQEAGFTGPAFATAVPIITGLPVPNLDHSVNGLEFDFQGDLYIAVGGNTNAGVPQCGMGGLPESSPRP
jgi:hypothetical protein